MRLGGSIGPGSVTLLFSHHSSFSTRAIDSCACPISTLHSHSTFHIPTDSTVRALPHISHKHGRASIGGGVAVVVPWFPRRFPQLWRVVDKLKRKLLAGCSVVVDSLANIFSLGKSESNRSNATTTFPSSASTLLSQQGGNRMELVDNSVCTLPCHLVYNGCLDVAATQAPSYPLSDLSC